MSNSPPNDITAARKAVSYWLESYNITADEVMEEHAVVILKALDAMLPSGNKTPENDEKAPNVPEREDVRQGEIRVVSQNDEAIALINRWLSEPGTYDQENWEKLKPYLRTTEPVSGKLMLTGKEIAAAHKRWMDAGCPRSMALEAEYVD